MRSAVNWAVLGLVIERPSYGYELFQRLERRYGGVLDPPISQIYAALNALERAALIEPLPEEDRLLVPDDGLRPAARRQPKVHYRATASGARAFREWVADQMRDDPRHVELLRRIAGTAAAGVDRAGTMRALVDAYERACVEEASKLPLPPLRDGVTPAAAAGELVERLVLAARRGLLDAHFAWITYARKEIEAYEQTRVEAIDEPADA
ncbi:MAG TPA: helix-turn-helix transcriptional regulator [Conexibacter sp.]|nr:helix-turn-helix transcriptional regulator [Conexibacter sp.]